MVGAWKSLAAAAFVLATVGGAHAADETPAAETDEVALAASAASDGQVEEVVAKAKRPPAMEHIDVEDIEPKITVSVGRIELERPKLDLLRKPVTE